MLPENIAQKAKLELSQKLGKTVQIKSSNAIGGGCINNALKLITSEGPFFLKWNTPHEFPGMFHAEGKGITLLRSTKEIFVPEVIAVFEDSQYTFLILEYIAQGAMKKGFWNNFGHSLAALHRHASNSFGLDHDNYIGSLPQRNKTHNNWIDFFIEERISPQMKMAAITGELGSKFQNLFSRLGEIFPEEPPALLHGDLWNGNYMVSKDGDAAIIDPAVYYGHREMDIAMSRLFGGFSQEFYTSYNEAYPMETDWENRIDICNLYPLLVHVNLFGGSYLSQVQSILAKF